MKVELLMSVLEVALVYYHKVGMGHTELMLKGVDASDRHPFVILPNPGVVASLKLNPTRCRPVTLAELPSKLAGASGPIAWEHTSLEAVLRGCNSRILELEADLREAQKELEHLKTMQKDANKL